MATSYAETEYVFPTVIHEGDPGWYAELESAHRPPLTAYEQGQEDTAPRTPGSVALQETIEN